VHSHANRSRLVLPVAVALALGLISVPHKPVSATAIPRLTEVSAVRLQAEVSSLVTGMAGALSAEPSAEAAANSLTGSATTAVVDSCVYPCTFFDKFLSSLPEDVRYAILPAVYVVAWWVGLIISPVILVTSALFGWPYSLPSAAAATPQTAPEPAEATTPASDPIGAGSDQEAGAGQEAVPAVPGGNAVGNEAAGISTESDDNSLRGSAQRTIEAGTNPAVSSVSAEASALPDTAATEPTPTAEMSTEATNAAKDAAPVQDRPAQLPGGSLEAGSPEIGSPEIGSPEIGSPEIGSPEAGSPEAGSPESPEIASPGTAPTEAGPTTGPSGATDAGPADSARASQRASTR
jgi:hypothetical protein